MFPYITRLTFVVFKYGKFRVVVFSPSSIILLLLLFYYYHLIIVVVVLLFLPIIIIIIVSFFLSLSASLHDADDQTLCTKFASKRADASNFDLQRCR